MNIFLSLKKIFNASADTCLNMVEIRKVCGREIDSLSAQLNLSDRQCVLLAAIVALSPYDGAGMVNLSNGFGCSVMDLYSMMPDFNTLVDKGFARRVVRNSEPKFFVLSGVLEAFCENKAPAASVDKPRRTPTSDDRPLAGVTEADDGHQDLLLPAMKHPDKQLFFSPDVQAQYDELATLLQNDNLSQINRRLREAGLKAGFTCLFYGPPGTGKTEAVYQLANATGRPLFQADMSQIHGKWVGESEKNARQIFTQYFAQILKCKSTPILLLNEADAIINRRLEYTDTSTGQMYNRVQNIILQALEDFQGILIATTNLENLFDPAFERRFLFKMHFTLPDADVRSRLWQSVIPSLSADDCRTLADEYPAFAGGQIVNVGRKAIIDTALHGTDITLQRLRDFCLHETLAPHKNNLGFRVSA